METSQQPRILELAQTFRSIPEAAWNMAPGSGTWTRRQILGHLVDSAANNLQRFVRIQFEDRPIIYYDQNQWVDASHYTRYDITNLIDLWLSSNLHLMHIITYITPAARQRTGAGADGVPQTLSWYITDYFQHLEHHTAQIQSR